MTATTETEYEGSSESFHPVDYFVFSLVLAFSAAIGVFFACRKGGQKTTQEVLMANREMGIFPVSLSLLASFMSAITLLGTPAEMYQFGTQYWLIWLGYCITIPLAAHLYVPVFFNLKLTSVFEYLELRFDRITRLCCVCAYLLQMTVYMAIVLYAPSLALSAVTGINVWLSVFSVGIVCTFYTTIGGMKAVMWTDVFQIIIMFAGLTAVLVQGSIDHGGFSKIWQYMVDGERIEFDVLDPNPLVRHTVWSLIFGGSITWLGIYGVNQSQVQRALAVPRLRDAQIALWINLLGLTALLTICSLAGFVVYAQYKDCDPLLTNRIKKADQLLPLYVMDALGHLRGLPGLFTASLFSGALSTISSGLNSLSAVVLQDIIKIFCFKDLSERRATQITKLIALGFGALCVVLTFPASQMGDVLQAALALFGMLAGPVLGVFTLGMICPCANSKGAVSGFLVSLVVTLWVGLGAQVFKVKQPTKPYSTAGCNITSTSYTTETWTSTFSTSPPTLPDSYEGLIIYKTSYMWYSLIAVFLVLIVGYLVSLLTGPLKQGEVPTELLATQLRSLNCARCIGVTNEHQLDEKYKVKDKESGFENHAIQQEVSSNKENGTHVTRF